MHSIFIIAILFSATFAGASLLLELKGFEALTKDGLEARIEERAYVSRPASKARVISVQHLAYNG